MFGVTFRTSWRFDLPNKLLTRRVEGMVIKRTRGDFPNSAGILLGLGLGGFFGGIVFHQVLQWRHMLASEFLELSTIAVAAGTLAPGCG